MGDKLYNGFKIHLCALLVLASSFLNYEFTFASTLPGEKCNIDPHPSWSSQEKWVWQKICSGDIADFNEAEGGFLDPFHDKNWPKSRIVTQTFIERIILHKSYREALPRQGINIVGAWFDQPIDLSDASLEHPLKLHLSRFDKGVDLSFLKTSKPISFRGSKFKGVLFMYGAKIDSDLLMEFVEFDSEINMQSAEVSRVLSIGGLKPEKPEWGRELQPSKFRAKVNMESLRVGGHCIVQDAEFEKEVSLRSAKITGQLSMGGSSKFKGKVDMDKIEVGQTLFLTKDPQSRDPKSKSPEFWDEVILRSAKVGGQLVMGEGSKFKGQLNMGGLNVNSALFMEKAEFDGEINLNSAKIGGMLDMSSSRFKRKVNMDKLEVYSSLFLREEAVFKEEIILRSAKIGSQLDMSSSKFKNKLNMEGLKVEEDLYMRGTEVDGEVTLIGATVGEEFDIAGSKFASKVRMDNLQVDHFLHMRNSIFEKPVLVLSAKIGNLNISNSRFSSLDLSATQINGELILGSDIREDVRKPPKWDDGAELILSNTSVSVLIDREDSWPDKLELNGFTYSSFGESRDKEWFKKWLEKQKSYSPQPYEQLAKVLQEEGHPSKAKEVLYWSKNREKTTTEGLDYGWLTFLQWTIGYGYKLSLIFWWVFGITAFGAVWLICFKQGPGKDNIKQGGIRNLVKGIVDNLFYSFDKLVPIIKLDEWSTVELAGFVRYYFYLHKIAGYVLSFAIIAWLTGIVYK
jgi:cytoskeletal protein CcmA (bactofilin family)